MSGDNNSGAAERQRREMVRAIAKGVEIGIADYHRQYVVPLAGYLKSLEARIAALEPQAEPEGDHAAV